MGYVRTAPCMLAIMVCHRFLSGCVFMLFGHAFCMKFSELPCNDKKRGVRLGAVPIWTCCPHRIGHRQTLSSLYHPGFASTVNSNSPLQPSATSEDEKLRIPELRGWHITLTDLLNLTIFNPKSLGLTPDLGVSRLHQLQKETSWSSRTSSQFQATGMHFVSYGSATCYAAESFHIHLCNLPILGW